jgi:hypothetical protein
MANSLNSEVNKLTRILSTGDARMKFTIRVTMPDGSAMEWQSDSQINVGWNDSLRAPWLFETASYQNTGIMPWKDGMVILCERNKDVKD